jgi:hypothetical protein
MDALAIVGTLCLGILVGLLIGWYLDQEQPFTITALVTVTSILSGAGVLGVFRLITPVGGLREFWFYPIGLLVGVLIAPPLDRYYDSLFETSKKTNGIKGSAAKKP